MANYTRMRRRRVPNYVSSFLPKGRPRGTAATISRMPEVPEELKNYYEKNRRNPNIRWLNNNSVLPAPGYRTVSDAAYERALDMMYRQQIHEMDMAVLRHMQAEALAAKKWRAEVAERQRREAVEAKIRDELEKRMLRNPEFVARTQAAKLANELARRKMESMPRRDLMTDYEVQTSMSAVQKWLRGEPLNSFESMSVTRMFSPEQLMAMRMQQEKARPKMEYSAKDSPLIAAMRGVSKVKQDSLMRNLPVSQNPALAVLQFELQSALANPQEKNPLAVQLRKFVEMYAPPSKYNELFKLGARSIVEGQNPLDAVLRALHQYQDEFRRAEDKRFIQTDTGQILPIEETRKGFFGGIYPDPKAPKTQFSPEGLVPIDKLREEFYGTSIYDKLMGIPSSTSPPSNFSDQKNYTSLSTGTEEYDPYALLSAVNPQYSPSAQFQPDQNWGDWEYLSTTSPPSVSTDIVVASNWTDDLVDYLRNLPQPQREEPYVPAAEPPINVAYTDVPQYWYDLYDYLPINWEDYMYA